MFVSKCSWCSLTSSCHAFHSPYNTCGKSTCVASGTMSFTAACSLSSCPVFLHTPELAAIETAFQSDDGVTVRVTSPAELYTSKLESATVWRSDLPLGLFTAPREKASDRAGVILAPGKTHVACAYPVNAETVARVRADNHDVK